MASRQDLGSARKIERLRGLVRDMARLNATAADTLVQDAASKMQTAAAAIAASLEWWAETLGRKNPDPVLVEWAGKAVARSQANHQATILDRNIAEQQRVLAAAHLARAEAMLEASRLSARSIQHNYQHRATEIAAQEIEDMMLRRRRR